MDYQLMRERRILLLMFLLLLVRARLAQAQSLDTDFGVTTTAGNNCPTSFMIGPNTITAGDAIIVLCSAGNNIVNGSNNVGVVTTVTDGGDSFTVDNFCGETGGTCPSHNFALSLAWANNVVGGSTTITVNYSRQSIGSCQVKCSLTSWNANITGKDQSAFSSFVFSSTLTGSTITTLNAADLILAWIGNATSGGSFVAPILPWTLSGGSFTALTNSYDATSNTGIAPGYRIVATTGTYGTSYSSAMQEYRGDAIEALTLGPTSTATPTPTGTPTQTPTATPTATPTPTQTPTASPTPTLSPTPTPTPTVSPTPGPTGTATPTAVATLAPSHIRWMTGWESGSFEGGIVGNPVVDAANPRGNGNEGGYSLELHPYTGFVFIVPPVGLPASFARFGLFVTMADPARDHVYVLGGPVGFQNIPVSFVALKTKTDCTAFLQTYVYQNNQAGGGPAVQAGNDVPINLGQWYRIDFATVIGNPGTLELRVNGTVKTTASVKNDYWGIPNSYNFIMIPISGFPLTGTGNVWMDDVVVRDDQYAPDGYIIGRSGNGVVATPTYDSWTKVGGATINSVWSDIPPGIATYAQSSTIGAGQTMILEPFTSVSSQSQRGNGTVGASDTINAAQIMALASQNLFLFNPILRWIASGNTSDSTFGNSCSQCSLGSGIGWQSSAPFTPSYADLNAGTPEAGLVVPSTFGPNSGTLKGYDTLVQLDYLPAIPYPSATPTPGPPPFGCVGYSPTPTPTATQTPTATPTPIPVPPAACNFSPVPDQCANASGSRPCTLPGFAPASGTPVQVLNSNGNRRHLLVSNLGPATIYVIAGTGAAGQDYTYGQPVGPGQTFDVQIQPDPVKAQHIWTTAISVATKPNTQGACFVYSEQSN